jgi:Tfp pilus assembly protein PilV
MKKQNSQGFALVEGALIGVIVIIIGLVGWYVLQSKNQADKNFKNADTALDTKPLATKTTDQQQAATAQPAANTTTNTSTSTSTPAPKKNSAPAPTPAPAPTSSVKHPTSADCPTYGGHFTVYASTATGTPEFGNSTFSQSTGNTVAYGIAITDVGCWQDTNSSILFKYVGAKQVFYRGQDVSITKP